MIRISIRLAMSGGWIHRFLSFLMVVLIAVTITLLGIGLSLPSALKERAARDLSATTHGVDWGITYAPNTLRLATTLDRWQGRDVSMMVVDAGNAPETKPPLGIERWPGPGQALVSPELQNEQQVDPGLAARYGDVVGILPNSALIGPRDLVVVVGTDKPLSGAQWGTHFTTGQLDQAGPVAAAALGMAILSLAGPLAALLWVSVWVLVSVRRPRFETLRALGASRNKIARLAMTETGILILFGALASRAAIEPLVVARMAAVEYEGHAWFSSELTPSLLTRIVVIGAVFSIAAVLVARTVQEMLSGEPESEHARSPLGNVLGFAGMLLVVGSMAWAATPTMSGLRLAPVLGLVGCLLMASTVLRITAAGLTKMGSHLALVIGARLRNRPLAGLQGTLAAVVGISFLTGYTVLNPAAQAELTKGLEAVSLDEQVAIVNAAPLDELQQMHIRQGLSVRGLDTSPVFFQSVQGLALDSLSGQMGEVWIGDCAELVRVVRPDGVDCSTAEVFAASGALEETRDGGGLELRLIPPVAADMTARYSVFDEDPTLAQHPWFDETTHSIHSLVTLQDLARMGSQGVSGPRWILTGSYAEPWISDRLANAVAVRYTSAADLEAVRDVLQSVVPGSHVMTADSVFKDLYSDLIIYRQQVMWWALMGGVVAALAQILLSVVDMFRRNEQLLQLRMLGMSMRQLSVTTVLAQLVPLAILGAFCVLVVAVDAALASGQCPSVADVVGPYVAALGIMVAVQSLLVPVLRASTGKPALKPQWRPWIRC